jgi:Flp pilus assembly protein TadD
MTDERRQSVAPQVLLVLAGLQFADGDAYEMASTAAIRDEIEVASAEVVGGGVAAYIHRYFEAYRDDTPRAIEEIEAALALDPGNPFLYANRGAARQRLGLFDDGRRDAQTALRLGPDRWTVPLYLLGNDAYFLGDLDEAISYVSGVVELRPDDWFAVNYRGGLHYLNGEYDLARADYERAIALGPKANFPYVFSAMIALREGRMADAAALMKTVLADFTDPAFGNRIILALYGDEIPIIWGPTFSAFGNLILGLWKSDFGAVRSCHSRHRGRAGHQRSTG